MKNIFLFAIAATLFASSTVTSIPAAAAEQGSNFQQILEASRSERSNVSSYQRSALTSEQCCKICTQGKACGDTCISRDKICRVGPGCACDG
jgi:hypothetical protein